MRELNVPHEPIPGAGVPAQLLTDAHIDAPAASRV